MKGQNAYDSDPQAGRGHRTAGRVPRPHVLPPGEPIPDDALWIDLIEPTREEDRLVERHLSIEIPTKEEMADIEPSEILYTRTTPAT